MEFPGSGKYSGHWLGDNDADWSDMKASIIGEYIWGSSMDLSHVVFFMDNGLLWIYWTIKAHQLFLLYSYLKLSQLRVSIPDSSDS